MMPEIERRIAAGFRRAPGGNAALVGVSVLRRVGGGPAMREVSG